MDAAKRRDQIIQIISDQKKPISATAIANQLHVSRQIIVGDVALLRAKGYQIVATPRGYVLEHEVIDECTKTIAVQHTQAALQEELYTIIEHGGSVMDVIVDHPVYGQLCGNLHLYSKYDVDQFINKCQKEQASPLSQLTQGVHLHTIHVRDEASYQRILTALNEKGYLYQKDY